DACIDCGACVDTCPVNAIYAADQVPEQWRPFIAINADFYRR
ncbi:MAG TPA: 4Fe-4S binding protein, partial [Candidatus Dormibacteraeota bacterium]